MENQAPSRADKNIALVLWSVNSHFLVTNWASLFYDKWLAILLLKHFLRKLSKQFAYFVNTEPFASTTCMVDVFARKSHLPITSFVLHLADYAPIR